MGARFALPALTGHHLAALAVTRAILNGTDLEATGTVPALGGSDFYRALCSRPETREADDEQP